MASKLLELRPDRNLLNPDFNGYKLSLEKVSIFQEDLETPVHRVLPTPDQYSLLHAKLFGLHNFLHHDQFSFLASVYFIDINWNIKKATVYKETGRLTEITQIWQIPKNDDCTTDHSNFSLHFASPNIALISDGCGLLHIVETGNRDEVENWNLVYSDSVLDLNQCFTITDAVCLSSESGMTEMHCLLNTIERDAEDDGRFCTIINWVTLKQTRSSNWSPVALKCLKSAGQFYYCALERNCKYIYVASDGQFKFTSDTDTPICKETGKSQTEHAKVYSWFQTNNAITIRFSTGSAFSQQLLRVNSEPFRISVEYDERVLLQGQLQHRIDDSLTKWTVSENMLEVCISKSENGLMWQELVLGDQRGECIVDPNVVAQVHERLAHLCSDAQNTSGDIGPMYSSQQIEECDLSGNESAIFERLCAATHDVTHRINLGSMQLLTSIRLTADAAPALVLRYDVDACLWQPMNRNGEWSVSHEGTLLAFGYVQASKQQRKFSTCSKNLSYSVVCESSRHVFIYQQSRELLATELRNRRSGQRVGVVAEQQVVNLGNDEILGIFAHEDFLFLLAESTLTLLKIRC